MLEPLPSAVAATAGPASPCPGQSKRKARYDGAASGVKWRRASNPLGVAVWQRNGNVCAAPVLKERVRLSFFACASLPDPHHLFNAQLEGKSHGIDFYEGDRLDEPALKALVRAGVEQNLSSAKSP